MLVRGRPSATGSNAKTLLWGLIGVVSEEYIEICGRGGLDQGVLSQIGKGETPANASKVPVPKAPCSYMAYTWVLK